jgi:hypothetical protein
MTAEVLEIGNRQLHVSSGSNYLPHIGRLFPPSNELEKVPDSSHFLNVNYLIY